MRDAHELLFDWTQQAGLLPRIDNAGNFIGRLGSRTGKKVLLLGSHLDSVPDAGRYDGVLGTLLSIAVCEMLGGVSLPFHIDVLGFSEEEGVRFNCPYLGSAALAGRFDMAWLGREDVSGVTMREAIRAFGLVPEEIDACRYEAGEVIGYIEPHLEQGSMLDRLDQPVGVVTGIAGQSRLRLTFTGEAGHAGTAPMVDRCDAILAAARFVCDVRAEALSADGLKATVGSLQVDPNASNVIAGLVELSLDVRHLDDTVRDAAIERLLVKGRQIASEERCCFDVLEHCCQLSVRSDRQLIATLADAIAEVNGRVVELESGAGHDAVIMGQHVPMAMMFLRHPGGVSHHPKERVKVEDVAVAIHVLTRCVLRLADHF